MSGEMKMEPTQQVASGREIEETFIIDEHGKRVTVIILPDDGPLERIVEDISLDGDPDDGGKGLPGEGAADSISLQGEPDDDGKGVP